MADDLSIGSSIDGDLNDFLQTQGILESYESTYRKEETSMTVDGTGQGQGTGKSTIQVEMNEDSLFLDNSLSNDEGTSISGIDTADVLLSSCKKVNAVLNRNGHFPVQFTSSDINNSNK